MKEACCRVIILENQKIISNISINKGKAVNYDYVAYKNDQEAHLIM